ncbi:MAG: hypothetical protein ABDK94_04410 [Atribacterota bacterium]
MVRKASILRLSLVLLFLLVLIPVAFPGESQITLTGRAFIPVRGESGKITERFFAFVPVEVIDMRTGQVVTEGETRVSGRYRVTVKEPGLYLLHIGEGNRVILDVSPEVREAKRYDLSYAGARSTALVMVLSRLALGKKDPTSVFIYKTPLVLRSERFKELENLVRKTLAQGENLWESWEIQELLETIATQLRES